MNDLQDFIDNMQTKDDAVDEVLRKLQADNHTLDIIREAFKEFRILRSKVTDVLVQQVDVSELLDDSLFNARPGSLHSSYVPNWQLENQSKQGYTSELKLSPLHLSVTMDNIMFNSIMHAFQASKVRYDLKYEHSDLSSHALIDEQYQRIKSFATPSLNTVNEWGGSKGSIKLDIVRWDAEKESIMREILRDACKQNLVVQNALQSYSGPIYEDTLPDKYWGYCDGQGNNTLGKLWQDIRDNDYQSITQVKKAKHS